LKLSPTLRRAKTLRSFSRGQGPRHAGPHKPLSDSVTGERAPIRCAGLVVIDDLSSRGVSGEASGGLYRIVAATNSLTWLCLMPIWAGRNSARILSAEAAMAA
jgi:hypothetical protein